MCDTTITSEIFSVDHCSDGMGSAEESDKHSSNNGQGMIQWNLFLTTT